MVGAIAVVSTLAYLAVQIRHPKVGVKCAKFQNTLLSFNPINMAVASDASLAKLLARGNADLAFLDADGL